MEALNTLSELYAAPSAPAKGKEVQHANDDDFDGKVLTGGAISDSLGFLESLPPGETSARARKNLRRDIENKLAVGSQNFLKAFGEVDQVCICSSPFLWLALFGTRGVNIASRFDSEIPDSLTLPRATKHEQLARGKRQQQPDLKTRGLPFLHEASPGLAQRQILQERKTVMRRCRRLSKKEGEGKQMWMLFTLESFPTRGRQCQSFLYWSLSGMVQDLGCLVSW